MNLFTPPTDNLYKFIAIFGLVIMLGSVFLPVTVLQTWEKNALPTASAEASIQADAEFLQEDESKEMSAKIADPKIAASLEVRKRNLEKRKMMLKTQEDIFNSENRTYKLILANWTNSFWLGFAIMLLGFALWDRKLQRYQDIIATLNPITGLPLIPSPKRHRNARHNLGSESTTKQSTSQ